MYFDFRVYFQIARLAAREPFQPRRALFLFLLFSAMTLNSVFAMTCLALDHIFFPGFRRVEVKAPIFVVGSGRSGTTHLHRLLCGDEARFAYFRTWEILLPSILQRKLLAAIGAFDERVLGGRWRRALTAREDSALAKARRMRDWRLDGAEEDEFILLHNWSSASLTVLFPYLRELEESISEVDRLPPWRRRRMVAFYRGLIQRQLYLAGADRTFCSKNPSFVPKMRTLLEAFPDARFVYAARHPYETIPSMLNLLDKTWRAMGTDAGTAEDSIACLSERMLKDYRYAFEVMDELPESRTAVARFGDLVEHPKATIEDLYKRFGMEVSPEYGAFLEAEQEKSRSYRSEHRYDAKGHGLSRERVASELAEIFERMGWES